MLSLAAAVSGVCCGRICRVLARSADLTLLQRTEERIKQGDVRVFGGGSIVAVFLWYAIVLNVGVCVVLKARKGGGWGWGGGGGGGGGEVRVRDRSFELNYVCTHPGHVYL